MSINKQNIIDKEMELIEYIKTSNIEALDNILHDDLLFIVPTGQVITKQMDLASHKAHEMIVEELRPIIESINIIDNTAVVIVVYDTKGSMLGTPIQGNFRYIRVWKQFDTGLKVIGGSCFKLD